VWPHVSPDEASIEREFNLVHYEWQFPPSFNVAPTQSASVVRIAADYSFYTTTPYVGFDPSLSGHDLKSSPAIAKYQMD
jgi:hypothetical protein